MDRWPVILCATLGLLACAGETPEQANERVLRETELARQSFEAAHRNYERWTSEKKPDSIATLFTPNGRQMPPNVPSVVGREAITAAEAAGHQVYDGSLTITSEMAVVNGPLGVESGRYHFVGTPTRTAPRGTPPMDEEGKYLAHWHLVDGQWLLAELAFSSNSPPPQAVTRR